MTFEIESDIPQVNNKRGRKPTDFPLENMQVGDSFLIPVIVQLAEDATDSEKAEEFKKSVESWRRRFLLAKIRYMGKHGGKFSTAIVTDGLRVWRTE